MSETASLASSIQDFLNKLNKEPSTLPAQSPTPLTNLVGILSSAVTKQPTSTLPAQVSATVPATQPDKQELLNNGVDILSSAVTTQPVQVSATVPATQPDKQELLNNGVDILSSAVTKQPTSTPRVEVPTPAQDGSTPKDKEELLNNLVDILPGAKQPTSTPRVEVPTPAQDGSTPKDKEEHLDAVLDILNHTLPTPAQDGSTPKDKEEHLDAVLGILNHTFTTLPTPAPNGSTQPDKQKLLDAVIDILNNTFTTLPTHATDGSTQQDKQEQLTNLMDILNHTFTTLPTPEQKPQCEPCNNPGSAWLPDKDSLINQINEWFKSVAAGFIPKQNIKYSDYKLPTGKENYKYIGHFNVEQTDKPVYQKHISVDPDNYEIFVDETPIIPQ